MAWDELEGHFTREVAWEDLRDARFESCTFEGVDWSGKDVRGARFEDCTFVACDLSNMRTLSLGLQHVTFRGCKLVGFDFSSCNALGFQVHMEDCIVDAANVEATDFRNVTWKGGRAHGADFTGANLEGVVLDGVDLEGALFGQTKLAGADFRTATGWRIRPEENRVKGAKFRRDDLLGLVEGWDLDLS